MVLIEPEGEKPFGDARCTRIIFFAPLFHGIAELFDKQQLTRTASIYNLEFILFPYLFAQLGCCCQVGLAGRNLGKVLVVRNDSLGHSYFTSTSNVWDVSLPKMSTAFTMIVYVPGSS